MKSLELIKVWTGSGYGNYEARLMTQVKRENNVAMYSRTIQKTGVQEGWEVFKFKFIKAGTQLPGGQVEKEDREQYPSDNAFGRHAWHVSTLDRANELFNELLKVKVVEPITPKEVVVKAPRTPKETQLINLPNHEFTINEVVESSKITYPIVYLFIKAQVENGSVKITRKVPNSSGRGRQTNIYAKV